MLGIFCLENCSVILNIKTRKPNIPFFFNLFFLRVELLDYLDSIDCSLEDFQAMLSGRQFSIDPDLLVDVGTLNILCCTGSLFIREDEQMGSGQQRRVIIICF